MEILKPFGPPLYKNNITINEIDKINNYIDDVLIIDKKKKKKLDASNSLVGKVREEIFIEKEFLEKIY